MKTASTNKSSTKDSTSHKDGAPSKFTNKWLALVIINLGTLVSVLNTSSINIANPLLADEFHITMPQVQWVTTIYLIILSALLLLMGRIGDRIGSHKLYTVGILIFTLGSVSCGLSNGLFLLIAARTLQAIGASMVMSTGMGLLTTIFPVNQIGMAIGINTIMVALGNMLGPSIGGFILAVTSWHMIFFLNVPVGIVAAVLAVIFLRSPVPPLRNTNPLDKWGTIILAILLTSLILAFSGGFTGSSWFYLLFVVLIPVFLLVERRQREPLLEYSLIKNRRFSVGNLVAFFSYTGNMFFFFQLPFFLRDLWGLSVGMTGLLIMTTSVTMAVAGPIAGIISDRIGAMRLMPIALTVAISGLLVSLFLPIEANFVHFIIALALLGAGMGFLNTPNNSEIMVAGGRRFASYAGGFVSTNRNLAFCIGTGASAGFFYFLQTQFEIDMVANEAYYSAFRGILVVSLALMLIALILCLYLRKVEGTKPLNGESEKNSKAPELNE